MVSFGFARFRFVSFRFVDYNKPVLEIADLILDLIWAEKDSFESRIIPKCLCSTTFFTGMLLKRITGWSISIFFLENVNSIIWKSAKSFSEILCDSVDFISIILQGGVIWVYWDFARISLQIALCKNWPWLPNQNKNGNNTASKWMCASETT